MGSFFPVSCRNDDNKRSYVIENINTYARNNKISYAIEVQRKTSPN